MEALGHVVSARLLERRLNETLDAGTGTGTGPGVGVGPAVGVATESAIGAGDGAARFERFLAMVEEVEAGGREAIVSGHGPDGPVRVEARLVVGADGADSAVRRAAGLPLRVHRCDHVAIAGDLSAELAHRGRAFERFTERGPLAVLPLGKDRCGFVWAVPESIASDERFGDCEFGTRLAEAFGSRLGRLGQVDVRVRHPLRVCHAPRITAPRTVLVGNAANALHPVGAQGFNLGLRDVEALARTLGDASARGADPASVLDRYALERRPDHAWGRLLTGALLRVYGSRAPLAPALGAAALFALDRFGPVKRQFASRTMGAGWPLPAGVVRVLDGTGFAGRWGTSRAD